LVKNNQNKTTTVSAVKQVLRHSFIYGISASMQSLVGFILLPILTNFITPRSFGVYSILLLMGAFASAIFYLGASSALGRFFFDEDNETHKKKVISTAFFITLFGAILLISISILTASYLSLKLFSTEKYSLHIILTLSGASMGFLLNLMSIILRFKKKATSFLFISIVGLVINFVTTYYLLSQRNFQILAPIYGNLISNSVCFILLVFLSLDQFIWNIEKRYYKNILTFGIQASAIGLLFYLLEWVDRLIIKDLLNLESVGIYSLGYRISAIINVLFITPFSLVWAPTRMEYAQKSNAKELMSKMSSYYSVAGVLFVSIALLFGADLMKILFKNPEYQLAANVFPLVMLANFFFGFQNILDIGIHISKKLYFYIIISAISIIINVGLNLLLIPKYGYMAAAYVNLVTYMLGSILSYLISNKYYKIKLELKRLLSLFLYLVILFIIVNISNARQINFRFTIKVGILVLSFFLFYRYWLQASERNSIRFLWNNEIKKRIRY
jgi:O-antigen/teichoic acid export membrane protein